MIFGMSLCLTAQAQSDGQKKTGQVGPVGPVAVQKTSPIKVIDEASAPAGWKRYEFGEGPVISALLPNQPREFSEQKSLGGPKPTTMRAYTSKIEEAIFTAFYAEDLPFVAERMTEDIRKSFFDGMWKGFAQGMQKGLEEQGLLFTLTALEQRPITIDGLRGVEQNFTVGPMLGRAQMSIVGQRAFMAIAFWSEDSPPGERTAFFNSFRIHAQP